MKQKYSKGEKRQAVLTHSSSLLTSQPRPRNRGIQPSQDKHPEQDACYEQQKPCAIGLTTLSFKNHHADNSCHRDDGSGCAQHLVLGAHEYQDFRESVIAAATAAAAAAVASAVISAAIISTAVAATAAVAIAGAPACAATVATSTAATPGTTQRSAEEKNDHNDHDYQDNYQDHTTTGHFFQSSLVELS